MNSSRRPVRDYTRGFQGQPVVGFEFNAVLPDGRRRPYASAEKVNLKPDRRRKKNQKYAYLCCLDPHGRFRITKNVLTGSISFGVRLGKYYFTETLTTDKLVKLHAALSCMDSGTDHLAKKSYVDSDHFRVGLEFYRNEFSEKIKAQKKAYKISLKAHKRRR